MTGRAGDQRSGGATPRTPRPGGATPRTPRPGRAREHGGWSGLRDGLRDLFVATAAPAATPSGDEIRCGPDDDRAGGASAGRGASALPPAVPGPEELRKQRVSGRRRWYAGATVGLTFLVYAMVQAAVEGRPAGEVIAFELLGACFGAFYVAAPVWAGQGFASQAGGVGRKVLVLAVMLAITVPMIAIGGSGVTALWIYIGVAVAILFPLRTTLIVAVMLAVAMLVVAGAAGDALPWELALTLVALSLWMAGFAGNIRLTIELRNTREELARAAVAAERARIGRDLHDILGHSLTAIAVKASLARRLLGRSDDGGTERASAEVADVERLAREALADVRATAAGYRNVSLAGELAVARSVLQAAGIHAELPTAVDDVSPAGREAFGFVVREAVTNVVRHSGARRCLIELTRDSVRVSDDGRAGTAQAGTPERGGIVTSRPGGGLSGLAERLATVGGTLEAGPVPGGGFAVFARLAPVEGWAGSTGTAGPGATAVPAEPTRVDSGAPGPATVGGRPAPDRQGAG